MKEVLEKPLENPRFYHLRMSHVMAFLRCNNDLRGHAADFAQTSLPCPALPPHLPLERSVYISLKYLPSQLLHHLAFY